MPISYIEFRKELYPLGLFSLSHIKLHFPGFNVNNLLYWQKKGYILKLRREWYCFTEFTKLPEFRFLIANNIYTPSYISHQEALQFYGMIPEHIVDSTSITTKKTGTFNILSSTFKYYSVQPRLFFGYELKEMTVNGIKRKFLMADREKSMLDLLYIFNFYQSEEDLIGIRFNEIVLENDIDWDRMDRYLQRFGSKIMDKKIQTIQKIYQV